jgi:hypothetical protein
MATILPSDILTPAELAARLKVPLSWCYEQNRPRRKNAIPVIKMNGRLLRIHWPSVCEWLLSQSHTPQKSARRKAGAR